LSDLGGKSNLVAKHPEIASKLKKKVMEFYWAPLEALPWLEQRHQRTASGKSIKSAFVSVMVDFQRCPIMNCLRK
tara:strand:+ start:4586 stop:4810 length:225 start_codon:yes stop_codon:yes gene_type:complete